VARPSIYNYSDIVLYIKDMLDHRRANEPDFSVARICRSLRRCSPALISNILAGKRKLTLERVGDVGTILGLSLRERGYLKDWVLSGEVLSKDENTHEHENTAKVPGVRRRVSSFLLAHWLHPYVKDVIRLKSVQQDKEQIYRELGGIASRKQIDHSLKFLQHHGYLRVNQAGKLVESEPVNVVGDEDADQKIRDFHKHALEIAKQGLEEYGIEERLAQALLIPLDEPSYVRLMALISEFAEKLRDFSEQHIAADQRLYQIVLHVTPTGGGNLK
jgi:uncharacterized protein (TIGR02147 family)